MTHAQFHRARRPRLSEHLSALEIRINRDNCTGLSTGGDKTRNLKFLVAKAINPGKKIVLLLTVSAIGLTGRRPCFDVPK